MDIGQPTSFFVGCALNLNPNLIEDEIRNLQRKLDAGADFVLTQPTYSPSDALRNLDAITKAMAGSPVPILVGILPLASARHAAYLHHEVPGILVPDDIRRRMESAGEDGARTGMEIAIELICTLRPAIQGVYLMPAFSRYDIAAEIIETIKSE